jgi:hypothetical protein
MTTNNKSSNVNNLGKINVPFQSKTTNTISNKFLEYIKGIKKTLRKSIKGVGKHLYFKG